MRTLRKDIILLCFIKIPLRSPAGAQALSLWAGGCAFAVNYLDRYDR